jgi:hypothetical protein
MTNFSGSVGDNGDFGMSFPGGDIILPGMEVPGVHHPVGDGRQPNTTVVESLIALVQKQAAHITFLEEEYNQRDARERSLKGQTFSPQSATQNSSFMNQEFSSFGPPPVATDMAHVPKDEVLLFSGKGFNTNYLGASNPLSIVSTSPRILQNVSMVPRSELHTFNVALLGTFRICLKC